MLYNIAPSNADRVKSQLTVCKIEAPAGYTACYRITHNMLEYELWELSRPEYPLYIIKTANGKDIYFITFGEITESTISVYSAEILKNGNPNDTRTERAERYLKKYDQLACAVHGLVSSGLLEEAEELETVKIDGFILEQYKPKPGTYAWRLRTASGEVVTSGHNTPEECKRAALDKSEEYLSHPEKYPKARGNAATVSERVIKALANTQETPRSKETTTAGENTTTTDTKPQEATESRHKYGMRLRGYSIGAQPAGVVERADDPTGLYYDIITYNRELTPEELDMYNLTPLTSTENAPQEPETNKAGETTTGAEKNAQRATQSEGATADDTTPTAGDTEPQGVAQTAKTTAGDTTTTPPHTEPPRAATGGRVSQSDRRTRPAAPQSHEATKGIQRHHRPPKTAYRATQRAATIPARYHHAQTTTSRGSPKICISWG